MFDFLLPPGLSPGIALLLVAVSFATSALTAAFGIGGGIAMLGALAGAAPPALIVAVHGVVQLGSNTGRALLQRAHVLWPQVLRFSLGSLAGAALGAAVFTSLPEQALLGLLGGFILLITWLPKLSLPGLSSAGMTLGGAVATFLTMFVGATGPFVQSVLLSLGLTRHQLVATHAMCMTIQHALKVLAFGLIGVAFLPWLPLVGLMVASGFAGTVLGSRLLDRLSDKAFKTILKWVLTLVALDLLRRAAGLSLA